VLGVFGVLPHGLRDVLYGFVARNRYRWFGRDEACRAPRAELQERFLD
jgi:predicted DCC family thiol-disulfide oxidoreductase YuxK